MTQESTADSTISRLESRLNDLHRDAKLVRERDRLGEIDARLGTLPQQIAALRSRGYLYRGTMEARLATLAARWPEARARAAAAVDAQAISLRSEVDRAEAAVRRLAPLRTRSLSSVQQTVQLAEDAVSAAERRVGAAREAVEAHYRALAGEVQQVERDAQACDRTMDLLDSATYSLEAGEGAVDAVEARWSADDAQVEGILFLTDRRLVFERREKVAKKKVLFITTASELVKEVRWQAPLSELDRVEASETRRALILKREVLSIAPRGGSGAAPAEFELHADSDAWRALVLRCQAGEIASERTSAAPSVPEYVVPAKCPTCGGAFRRAGRIRGVAAVRCEFCGTSVALERAEGA